MLTRKKSLVDWGVRQEDVEILKDICRNATADRKKDILNCCRNACPKGIENFVYESITLNRSYDKIMKNKYIPIKKDDFYAYKRKSMAMFYGMIKKEKYNN